jgi:hypothetical protein
VQKSHTFCRELCITVLKLHFGRDLCIVVLLMQIGANVGGVMSSKADFIVSTAFTISAVARDVEQQNSIAISQSIKAVQPYFCN